MDAVIDMLITLMRVLVVALLEKTIPKNPTMMPSIRVEMRSIPVCTGEPLTNERAKTTPWVYPRVYGGTAVGRSIPVCTGEPIAVLPLLRRSIPVCTGEPITS